MDPVRRKRLGAWYTPDDVVEWVVARATEGMDLRASVSVLDPACGDGRFLLAAARRIAAAGGRAVLHGTDIDAAAVARARTSLAGHDARLRRGDALATDWRPGTFDLVVGNPPFLSQMASATSRGGASTWGGGPYADAAVEFLGLALRVVAPRGGRIGYVLPQSVLASRDAAPVRRAVAGAGALRWLWWSRTSVFDAAVRTCAVIVETGAAQGPVGISEGPGFAPAASAHDPQVAAGEWSRLLARALGVPALPGAMATDGVLRDRADVAADFRDQYYGLVGAVSDDADGPPLVTSGCIDPGVCRWGQRPVRFAKVPHRAPRVDLGRLSPAMRAWAAERLVPKVLVASQTRVVEAVVDAAGAWLPSVPVVSVVPRGSHAVSGDAPDAGRHGVGRGAARPGAAGPGGVASGGTGRGPAGLDAAPGGPGRGPGTPGGAVRVGPWDIAAVLTSPVASAWVAARAAGSGLSAPALRLSPGVLSALPWPSGDLGAAVAALRAGDVVGCGRAVVGAHGITGAPAQDLLTWWEGALPRALSARGQPATPRPAR